jgi:hypothetical protein
VLRQSQRSYERILRLTQRNPFCIIRVLVQFASQTICNVQSSRSVKRRMGYAVGPMMMGNRFNNQTIENGMFRLIDRRGPEGRRLNIAQPGRAGISREDDERRRRGTLPRYYPNLLSSCRVAA